MKSRTPGGLTVAQYDQDPFQNTRPTDYWNGERKAVDIGYLNTISANQEFEIRAYYNESYRNSALINSAATQLQFQPRNYNTLGIEPRFTQRFTLGPLQNDVTVGYRYIRERGDDNSYNQTLKTGLIKTCCSTTRSFSLQASHHRSSRISAQRVTKALKPP